MKSHINTIGIGEVSKYLSKVLKSQRNDVDGSNRLGKHMPQSDPGGLCCREWRNSNLNVAL